MFQGAFAWSDSVKQPWRNSPLCAAISTGILPVCRWRERYDEALRARVLADLAARSDAAGIIATAPAAAAAKDSPIIAAAKKAASDAKR